jgi:hypothetical protein
VTFIEPPAPVDEDEDDEEAVDDRPPPMPLDELPPALLELIVALVPSELLHARSAKPVRSPRNEA